MIWTRDERRGQGFHRIAPLTKLGVIALAGTDNGGTYQYTLSMLQALRHTSGFDVTLYGDPQNKDFAELGYPIRAFAEPRGRLTYGALSSPTGARSSSACTVSSVSISNPVESAGKDLTKRRENAL